MPALRYLVTGRVQGVGFRHAMTVQARQLKLRGWVRNRADGSVEAVAAGDPRVLQQLETWARHGPSAATVHHVQVRAATPDEAADVNEPFSQRPDA